MTIRTYHACKADLEHLAVLAIGEALKCVVQKKGKAVLGIPGGTSVSGIFDGFREMRVPWQQILTYMVDERLVSQDSPECNFNIARKSFADSLTQRGILPPHHLHPFLYDPSQTDHGIGIYNADFQQNAGTFDVLLLSSGEDGHVGALYPGHPSVSNPAYGFFGMSDSPKPPAERMASSRSLLGMADTAVLLFFGEKKRDALKAFQDPNVPVANCPAKLVETIKQVYVLTDISL